MEETQRLKKIIETLNSIYLTLIPKKDHPNSFNDLRCINLSNLLYKFVSNIIEERMNPFLGNFIMEEQISFFPDRKIIDVVGVVHECLHSVKFHKNNDFFLKVDLLKAYDKVDWSYLSLILVQIGLTPDIVDWIMSCMSTTRFFVLINGVPSSSFKGSRGIR